MPAAAYPPEKIKKISPELPPKPQTLVTER